MLNKFSNDKISDGRDKKMGINNKANQIGK